MRMCKMDSDLYYWLFSTIAQAFAAMIALVGMFVIHRLQIQKSRVETTRRIFIIKFHQSVRGSYNLAFNEQELFPLQSITDEELEEKVQTREGVLRGDIERLMEEIETSMAT
jgi:hypothetical protein